MEGEVLSYGRPRGGCCGCSGIQAGFLPKLGGPFLGVKLQGRETDRSLPSSAKVQNAWNCNTTPPVGQPTV